MPPRAAAAAATPFRMQATALGRTCLRPGRPDDRRRPARHVAPTTTPGPAADWRVTDRAARFGFSSVSTGKDLGVGTLRRLVQTASAAPRWKLSPPGLRHFPEVEVNVTGEPLGVRADGPVAASSTPTSTSAASGSSAGGSTAGAPGAPTASPSR